MRVGFFGIYPRSSHAPSTYWRSLLFSADPLPLPTWPKTSPRPSPTRPCRWSSSSSCGDSAPRTIGTVPLQSRCIADVDRHADRTVFRRPSLHIISSPLIPLSRSSLTLFLYFCSSLFRFRRDALRTISRSALTTSLYVLAYNSPERQVCQRPSYSADGLLRGRSLSSPLGLQPTRLYTCTRLTRFSFWPKA